jgi:hypothetical protein
MTRPSQTRVFWRFSREKEKTRIKSQGLESESFNESFCEKEKIGHIVLRKQILCTKLGRQLALFATVHIVWRSRRRKRHAIGQFKHCFGPNTGLFSNESFFRQTGLWLESDSDEYLPQRPKDSCSSEHDFSVFDPTLAQTPTQTPSCRQSILTIETAEKTRFLFSLFEAIGQEKGQYAKFKYVR